MIGKTISHYKILEKLGEGGMGLVYKAQDLKLDRFVALKFLPPHLVTDAIAKKRFIQEAKAASALDHPNICTVHEIGEIEGQTFIAMAYIGGQSLKDRIESGPLKLDESLNIAIEVAEGLEVVHKKSIVHRDIKSANLMVTDEGKAKITDFGLAKLAGGTKVTKTGMTVGTMAYMSPEQARGEDVDQRTDIWSLGVVLYEMVTGQLPFKGDYDEAVVYSILNEYPEPLTGLRTGVPIELERIVNKCIEKDPAERYQAAGDLVADLRHLQRITATRAPLTRFTSSQTDVGRIVRRWSWIAVLILIVALAIGILRRHFAPPGKQTVSERTMLVVLPFDNLGASEDEYFADGITEEITSRLATLHELGVISRTSAIQYKNTQKKIKQIGEELGVDYVLEGSVRWDRSGEDISRVRVTPQLIRVSDDTHLWSERYDRVLKDIFRIQSDIAEQVVKQLGIALLEPERRALQARPTENLDAYQAYLRGQDYEKREMYSEENWRLAIKMFERAVELDPTFTAAYAALSTAHSQLINLGFDRTQARLTMAKEAVDKALALQPEMPEAHLALGYYYYWGLHEYDKALEEFALAGEGLPNENAVLETTAWIRRRQGHWDECLDHATRAFDLSPRDAAMARELGNINRALHNNAKANKYYDRSIALAPDQQAAYVFKAVNYWSGWGDTKQGRAVLEAMPERSNPFSSFFWFYQELLERNYQAALDRLASQPYEFFELPNGLIPKELLAGLVYRLMGQPEPARRAFESALILLEKEAREQPSDARVHSSLGLVYAGLGRREEAIREGKLGVELYPVSRDAMHGPKQVELLANIYMLVGDYETALDKIEYLLSIPCALYAPLLRIDPQWDPLRDHPRFLQLLNQHQKTGS